MSSVAADVLGDRGAWGSTGGGSKKSLGGQPDVFQRRAEDYSSREAQAIRARVGRVAIGVTVAVVVVVIVATVATMTWFVAAPKAVVKPSAMRGYSLIAHLTAACSTNDCRTAMAMLNSSIDATANPCEDVYKYVCGKWHSVDDDGRPMTYEQTLKFTYVNAVDSKLVGNATVNSLCRAAHPQAKIGCIYASCVAFYTNRCVFVGV
ncbi:hypothetical protein HPB51_024109 [Rhipicephalus microplus]|uniref:Peptidase M13 N-terminal domain-containing protein n=1 Tax=Rhipicephalus microplus TaxID=6941 RepID=A0A9J6EDA3_RHIMP|nr:hypothetical protein HPB51_024109 [Rhipicephalus microplus]